MELFASVQEVNRETVVQFPILSDAAVAFDPTRSLPVTVERSLRYVELESFEETESAAVFAFESSVHGQWLRRDDLPSERTNPPTHACSHQQ